MNIISPIDCFTGYGITGYNIWKHLYEMDHNTTLFPIGSPNIEDSWNKEQLSQSVKNQQKFNSHLPCLKIWHSNDLTIRTAGKSVYGGLTFFETDHIKENERIGYGLLDTIFAPSYWAKQILEQNNINNNIVVCPQGVDTEIFDASIPEDKTNDKYIFINIGKWEIRKGHDILSDIFNKAFSIDDNVELWMINTNPFLNEDQHNTWIKQYKETKLGDKVKIFPRLPSQKVLSRVMSYADCGIFPSRAEGWNNEAIEMLAMNKPLIITNYSAHTEYCSEENSLLVEITQTEPAKDNMWFDGSGNWASLKDNQIEQFVEHMRSVYYNNIRTNANGVLTAKKYTWNKTANIINKHLL